MPSPQEPAPLPIQPERREPYDVDYSAGGHAVTTSVVAREAVKRGLRGPEADAFVEKRLKPLHDEETELQKLCQQTLDWKHEQEQANSRAGDLCALVELAQNGLEEADAETQHRFLTLLDIKVQVKGRPPAKSNRVCDLVRWFSDKDRLVPNLTDEAWALVEPIMGQHRKLCSRTILDALLYKGRIGETWAAVGDR